MSLSMEELEKNSIKEALDSFQKDMWSHEKPLNYAIAIVEQLLIENKKLHKTLTSVLARNRDQFIEEVRSKLDFSQIENEEN